MMISKRVYRKNEPDFRLENSFINLIWFCSSNGLIVIKQLFSRIILYTYLREFLIWIRLNL